MGKKKKSGRVIEKIDKFIMRRPRVSVALGFCVGYILGGLF